MSRRVGSSRTNWAESRVLATMLTAIDGIDAQSAAKSGNYVFILAATNRLNAIDDALLRKVQANVAG
jgi:SpoVK/Ycf46/Vps4 family AAA+-type ATPase